MWKGQIKHQKDTNIEHQMLYVMNYNYENNLNIYWHSNNWYICIEER